VSFLEQILAQDLSDARIPFVREYQFAKEALNREWRADFWIMDSPLLIEVDGGTWMSHGGRHGRGEGRENDAEKDAAMWRLGYLPMHLTSKQVQNKFQELDGSYAKHSIAVEVIRCALRYFGEESA
jgi:very-short-patch-repair endonuclease